MDLLKAVDLRDLEAVRALLDAGHDVDSKDDSGETPLMKAAGQGCAEVVHALLRAGGDVDARSPNGFSALLKAADGGHAACARALLDAGADVGGVDFGLSALMVAAYSGHPEVVGMLVEAGANVRQVSLRFNDVTALMLAAGQGHTSVVDLLLASGAEVAGTDYRGDSSLVRAAEGGHTDTVRTLLAAGAEIEQQQDGTALIRAAEQGHTDTVRALLDAGAEIDVGIAYGQRPGWTALMMAASGGHADTVRVLLDAGADVHAEANAGFTAVSVARGWDIAALLEGAGAVDAPHLRFVGAGRVGDVEALKFLLESGLDPDVRDGEGNTALLWAAFEARREAVDCLIRAGADANARNERGQPPLRWAVCREDPEVVRLLLEAGADANALDDEGIAPLIAAAIVGDGAAVQLLTEAGADVDVQRADGDTPLAIAASSRNADLVRALIDAGADVDLCDCRGETPLIEAASGELSEIVEILIQAGADLDRQEYSGHTALMRAVDRGDADTVDRLIAAGADARLRNNWGTTALEMAHSCEEPAAARIVRALRAAEDAQFWNRQAGRLYGDPGEWDAAVTFADGETARSEETSREEAQVEEDMLRLMLDALTDEADERPEISAELEPDANAIEGASADEDVLDLPPIEEIDDGAAEGAAGEAPVEDERDTEGGEDTGAVVGSPTSSDPCRWDVETLIRFCKSLAENADAEGLEAALACREHAHPLLEGLLRCLVRYRGEDTEGVDWQLSRLADAEMDRRALRHRMLIDFTMLLMGGGHGSGPVAATLMSHYRRIDYSRWKAQVYAPCLDTGTGRDAGSTSQTALTGPGSPHRCPETGRTVYRLRDASLDELVGVLASIVELVRREGVLSVEAGVGVYDEDLIDEGLALAAEGYEPEYARAFLTARSAGIMADYQVRINLLRFAMLQIAFGSDPQQIEACLRALAG